MQSEPYGEQPGPPRRGRRDNGLDAERYVPLLDVDPRIGEHLLEVLRAAGVPAYLEPALDVEPYTRASSVPSPPTDRLWVDREMREEAGGIVAAETTAGLRPRPPEGYPSQGLTDPAEERAWQEIVAHYDEVGRPDSATSVLPPWPAAEDMATPAEPRPAANAADVVAADAPPHRAKPPAEPAPVEDEHYVPPPPPPVPRPSKHVVLAMLLIVLGTLLLLLPDHLGFDPHAALTLGVLSLIGAAALLIFRLRNDHHDNPGDGAVL